MLSIVIPAYNEENSIRECLDALARQDTDQEFEVIVIDNASTDETAKVAKEFGKKLNLRVIHESKKGRGAARARGFKEAKGQIIFSTDADAIVPKNWIGTLSTALKASSAVAVSGTGRITDCSKGTNAAFNRLQPLFMKAYKGAFRHYWLTGFNFAIYKDAYEKAGGFDEELNIQEDIDLSIRVAKIGKIQFISNVPVLVSGRRLEKGLLKGMTPYVTSYVNYRLKRKNAVYLSDVRG